KDKPREDIAEDGAEIIRTFILENLLCELKCFRVCLCELNYFCEMKGLLNSLLDDFLAEDNIMDDASHHYRNIGDTTALEALKKFVEGIIARISWHVGEYPEWAIFKKEDIEENLDLNERINQIFKIKDLHILKEAKQ
ncbi:hypothetical protein ACJX0J_012392, partial [Zea mays]